MSRLEIEEELRPRLRVTTKEGSNERFYGCCVICSN